MAQKARIFVNLKVTFGAFFAIFYHFFLAYVTQTPQAYMLTPVFSSKTSILTKKPEKISILPQIGIISVFFFCYFGSFL